MTTSGSESDFDPEQEEIEQKLLEGLRSPVVPMGNDFWKEIRRIAHERAQQSQPESEG